MVYILIKITIESLIYSIISNKYFYKKKYLYRAGGFWNYASSSIVIDAHLENITIGGGSITSCVNGYHFF